MSQETIEDVKPSMLYKYRVYNDYSIPMLTSGTLWAAKPSTLNDPFECQKMLRGFATSAAKARERHWATFVFFKMNELKSRVKSGQGWNGISNRGLRILQNRLESSGSLDDALAIMRMVFSDGNGNPDLKEPTDFMDLAERTLREVGIVSLSARVDEMLMWSHYAGSHHGYCLGFEVSSGAPLADSVHTSQVEYSADVPELDLDKLLIKKAFYPVGPFGRPHFETSLQLETESLRKVLFRKSPEWAYEEEWRHVVERGNREIQYPGRLREVVFGLRMAEATRQSLKNALPSTSGITFREVVVSSTSALEIRDL
ncbi:DUF2971 domain-containing protein [Paenarthrobacter sp. NPDC089675]|uniref:DUF2971 domain-containing protein n=1 Tax=Paenarthrobacter sp. NPDC089675 TaxID=3364376 RepID=UPI003823C09F